MAKEEMKLVANNKKAYHDYFIEEKYEAGLVFARYGGEIPAYGEVQYQRSFYPYRRRRSFYLRHAYQPL